MTEAESCRARIQREAPWLLDPALGTCVVGSSALAEACRRIEVAAPTVADLDLSWGLDIAAGQALLEKHDVFIQTTDANRARGTLGLRLGDERVEITSHRAAMGSADAPVIAQIEADLARRDMTIGAVAWWLSEDRIVDPHHGVDDWHARIVRPVGDVAERVREHPARWIRYFRKAHGWGFELDPSIRRLEHSGRAFDAVPCEALAGELRAILATTRSPGRCLLELEEIGLLRQFAPELAPQFDGRPAGPIRYHPEVSQALHLILALEWVVENSIHLPAPDRHAVRFAVLCHDLGKNLTQPAEFPSHRGHESAGLDLVDRLCDRLPGLADRAARALARDVCALHLVGRGLDQLRPGTLARYYEEHFRHSRFRTELFALAVAADSAGRLGLDKDGLEIATRIAGDIEQIRTRCETVDTRALRARHDDLDDFRRALHEARAAAIAGR